MHPAIDELRAARGVRVVVNDPPTPANEHVSYTCLGEEDLPRIERYLGHVRDAFFAYSPAFLAASRLRAVVIVDDLQVRGERRAAVPDDEPVLYLDPFIGVGDDAYQLHAIHHDFFHLVERQAFGRFGFDDPAWAALNDPPATYQWHTPVLPGVHALDHCRPGFINAYSTFRIEEDKAELFAALRVPEYRPTVERWAKDDPVLARKIAYLGDFVRLVEAHAPKSIGGVP